MNCPKCAHDMRKTQHKGIEYDQCKNCGGLWFDALEAEELIETARAVEVDTGDIKQAVELNQKRDINCPVCNVRMLKVHDREQPHIQLESCPTCKGTFFDAGEFTDFCEETFMDRVKDWLAKRR